MRGFGPGSPRLLGGRERGVVGRAGRGLGLASCTAARGVRRRGLSVSWMQTETGYLLVGQCVQWKPTTTTLPDSLP